MLRAAALWVHLGRPSSEATDNFPWPNSCGLADFEPCERHSAELVAYCTEKKVETFRLLAASAHACARAVREPTGENLAAIRNAIEAYHRSGSRAWDSSCYSHLAEASLAAGDAAGAETALQEAFALSINLASGSGLRTCSAFKARSRSRPCSRTGRGLKACSAKRSTSPTAKSRACSSCALGSTSPVSGARQVRPTTPVRRWSRSSHRSWAATPRGMCATRARCWQRSGDGS